MTEARIDLSAAPAGLEELLAGFPAYVKVEGRLSWTWHDPTFGSVSIEVSASPGPPHTIVVRTDGRSHVARERAHRIALRLHEHFGETSELTWMGQPRSDGP